MRQPAFSVDRATRTDRPLLGRLGSNVLRTSPRTGTAVRRRATACLTLLSAAAMTVLGMQIPAHAAAPSVASASGASSSPPGKSKAPPPPAAPVGRAAFGALFVSPAKKKVALAPSCATPKKGEAACFALRRTDTKAVK